VAEVTIMAVRPLHTILWHLHKMVSPPPARTVSDATLLSRFVNQRDESAFELIVWRHGPMVLSVCGRVLADAHAQEDAFQATFLTLVRKARSIGKGDSVGSWLHKVAHRIALRARVRAVARTAREQSLGSVPESAIAYTPPEDAGWAELRPVLDSEVRRLPEKYRAAFVLCYLEGKTNEEAAEELGCPQGTVFSRLSRAREMLRQRLARRGLAVQPGPLAAVLARKAPAREVVSPDLANSTVCGAVLFTSKAAAGQVAASVLELVEDVVKDMWLAKLKLTLAAGIALAVIAVTGAVGAYQTFVVKDPTPVQSGGSANPRDTGVNNDNNDQGTGHCCH
jgi:RNA polymerase sigma factor (sigma-70 family)